MTKPSLRNYTNFCRILALSLPLSLFAQPESNNHPELDWFSIETEHFYVHFHNGAEWTAQQVAKIAEQVYQPITALYNYRPGGKYHFVIRDHDDYSNGAAFYYDNKIEIWATAMDFELRGSHNWLQNVVTHEFTHMISLQAAMKITQRVPAFYLQAIAYEDERRPDVLRGGPNVLVSYPIAMMVAPGWFAEGVAQYQVPGLEYDTWDSHRDMILRTATLDDRLLSYNEMGVFGKNSLNNEKVYNHGYAFVSYLVDTYGLDTIRETFRNMKGFFRLTLDGALQEATGKDGRNLYYEWVASLKSRYKYQTREIVANRVDGEILAPKGLANFYPQWSPDGSRFAYLSSQSGDYLSQTSLVVQDVETGEVRMLQGGVHYAFSWSPDGSRIAFASKKARSKGGSHYYDLYVLDVENNDTERLTHALRAHSPAWSPDGSRIAFVRGNDGSENLGLLEIASGKVAYLTDFANGEQVYKPRWSPDGETILFGKSVARGRSIFLLRTDSREVEPLLEAADSDARDAVFSPDGRRVYFSWDKTGIFNIYSLDIESRESTQWTNVVGGAFMPDIDKKGRLLFSSFTSDGYKIAMIEQQQPVNESNAKYLTYKSDGHASSTPSFSPQALGSQKNGHNSANPSIPDFEVTGYKSHYSPIAFLPRLMLDYGTLKAGAYVYSADVLDKYGFIAGFDVNRFGDYDLFALIEFRQLWPTLFVEAYNQVQNTKVAVDSVELIRRGLFENTEDKFRYNLFEVDVGARFKLSDNLGLRAAFVFSRYGARAKFRENVGETTFSYTYFIGRDFSLRLNYRNYLPYKHSEINPIGRSITLGYDLAFDKFLEGFEIDNRFVDGIGEVFQPYNYHKLTLNWRENLALPIRNHTVSLDLQAGFIDAEVDSFFHFFGGGILGNRGYPYFSIEGRRLLQTRLTYRFPLFSHLDMRFMHMYFDKVFLGAFVDAGNAFNENSLDLGDFKRSVGLQLRMDSFSFYAFPMRFFLEAAYGLDRFSNTGQLYGKEWRWYFGFSFGYLD